MSVYGGNWNERIAVFASFLAALFVIAGTLVYTFHMGDMSARSDAEAQGYAAIYLNETEKKIENCRNEADQKGALKCIAEAIESGRDAQRSENELNFQRQAADWAFWALVVAVFSSLTTAVGTIMLYQQIVLTRKAVQDTGEATGAMNTANQIAALNARPWLIVDSLDIGWIQFRKIESRFHVSMSVELAVKNGGAIPARDVHISFLPFENPIGEHATKEVAQFARHHFESWGGLSMGLASREIPVPLSYCPQTMFDPACPDGTEAKDYFAGLAISTIYRPVTGGLGRQTVQVFRLTMGKDDTTAQTTGFWLENRIYRRDVLKVHAGSRMDFAT